jgi:PIN domain nuclease of toxin-antitoxin system
MRVLIDTHVLLWAVTEDVETAQSKLSPDARGLLRDGSNDIIVSAGTLYEIAIKVSIGKLPLPPEFPAMVKAHGYEILPIAPRHLEQLARLPLRHRDPFDRLLVAQAAVDGLVLLTADAQLRAYDEAEIQMARSKSR